MIEKRRSYRERFFTGSCHIERGYKVLEWAVHFVSNGVTHLGEVIREERVHRNTHRDEEVEDLFDTGRLLEPTGEDAGRLLLYQARSQIVPEYRSADGPSKIVE